MAASRGMSAAALLLLGLCLSVPHGTEAVAARRQLLQRQAAEQGANPIRKVVTMLQDMQTKVTEEGKKEEELYDKFMCYCKTSGGDLAQSIQEGGAKITTVSAQLKESTERKSQTEADLAEHQQSRADAKDTMAQATALREKEVAAFAKLKSDYETNIAAINKAVAALEKGAFSSFLQSSSASLVRQYAMERAELPDSTRQELLSFLSGSQEEGYVPQSGEITGILKRMGDEMSKFLADATAQENSAIQNYEALMAAKKKEVGSLQEQLETEMKRIGDLGVAIAEMTNDVENTQAALAQDEKFEKDLKADCATKTQEWEEIKKNRADELVALAETIKVLSDDDALELFKKTLPSASASSFVQVQAANTARRAKALKLLHGITAAQKSGNPGLDLIALALRGKKVGFDKIIKMIDDMVANLKKEQHGDDAKKEYCEVQFDQADDKKKALSLSVSDSESAIDEMQGALETLASDIADLETGIKALDKSVAEATQQRKAENADYKELMASDSTAKEVLGWAKNRLNKFYDKALYKPPPKRELTEAERITVNMGGVVTTPAPGGIAGTGIGASFVQLRAGREAPPPPPATFSAYAKRGEESSGVIAMIDLLIKELDKEMQEAGVTEKDAQADYEKMMEDAAAKRTTDLKSANGKAAEKASTEESLEAEKEKKAGTSKTLMATVKYMQALHSSCDWLMQYYDVRKSARSSEIDSLVNAKAVLSGADYAFLQASSSAASLAP